MTDKMKSFVKGILLGLCGYPLPQGEKEPVAYMYNGVRFPAVPVVDGRPFEAILVNEYWTDYVAVSLEPTRNPANGGRLITQEGSLYVQYRLEDGEWKKRHSSIIPSKTDLGGDTIWCNFDLYNMDGSLYLPKSDPIPVYE